MHHYHQFTKCWIVALRTRQFGMDAGPCGRASSGGLITVNGLSVYDVLESDKPPTKPHDPD
jgi:hypothetical protein